MGEISTIMASLEYRTYQFHTVGSAPLELDLVRDTTAPASPGPQKTLIFFHGGGLVSGNRRSRFPDLPLELSMRRGWLVLTADYRLLPESNVEDMIDDVKHLETWISMEGTRLGLDLGSIAVAGSSAGENYYRSFPHKPRVPPYVKREDIQIRSTNDLFHIC